MSDNPEALRTAFEQIMAGPPYERDVRRFPDDGRSAWPGNYRDIAVDLAWCVLRDCAGALAQQAATPAPAEPTCYVHREQLASLHSRPVDDSAVQARYGRGFPNWVPDSIRSQYVPLYAAPPATPAPAEPATDGTVLRRIWDDAYDAAKAQRAAEPVARIAVADSALGRRMSFCSLTDAGRALPDGSYDLHAAPPATPAAQPADEREAFETAMRQTWKMIDPLHPPGQPGSYARGEHNGIAAALRTVRENFNRAALKGQPEGQG